MRTHDLDANCEHLPIHLRECDPDTLEFSRVCFIAMIRQCREPNAELTDDESSILHSRLQAIIAQVSANKEGKSYIRDSNRRRRVFLMESDFNIEQLLHQGQIPRPVVPFSAFEKPSIPNDRYRPEAYASLDAYNVDNKDVSSLPTWPMEIAHDWRFYCRCGSCAVGSSDFRVRIGMVVDGGQFMMPVKVYITADDWISRSDGLILKATLTSQHHETVATSPYNLTVYNPQYKFDLVPHQLCLYQPPAERRPRDGGIGPFPPSFKCAFGEQDLVREWDEANDVWSLNPWTATNNNQWRGIRLVKPKKMNVFAVILALLVYAVTPK